MFERFTHDARSVVHLATTDRDDGTVDSVSLLLALAQIDAGPDSGAAGHVLREAGLDRRHLDAAARAVDRPGLGSSAPQNGSESSDGGPTSAPVDPGLDANALSSLGIDLDAIRAQADAVFGPGALDVPSRGETRRGRRTRFTPDAKKVLANAVQEAVGRHDRAITATHLLLGLLRDADSPAVRTLDAAGADLSALRAAASEPRPGRAA